MLQMFRFTIHCVQKSKTQPSLWTPAVYTFGHRDLRTCQMWVARINTFINMEAGRPKSLLVGWSLHIDWCMVCETGSSYIYINLNILAVKEFQILLMKIRFLLTRGVEKEMDVVPGKWWLRFFVRLEFKQRQV